MECGAELQQGKYVTSWLAIEDSDTLYPFKNAIIIKYGEGGYYRTDWKLSKEDIIARNKICGIEEEDRIKAEGLAIQLSAQADDWRGRKADFTQTLERKLRQTSKEGCCRIIADLLYVDGENDCQLKKLNEVQYGKKESEVE